MDTKAYIWALCADMYMLLNKLLSSKIDMDITPTLHSIDDLFGKLEREAYRAFHAVNARHVADHLYNFCITAHSLRDYFFEEKGLLYPDSRKIYVDVWKQEPLLVAVEEIANKAKHFTLRLRDKTPKSVKTMGVEPKSSQRINITEYPNGSHTADTVFYPSYVVRLESGSGYDLYSFTDGVKNYWQEFLGDEGVIISCQGLSGYIGERT